MAKILIVEDRHFLRKLILKDLSTNGHDVIAVEKDNLENELENNPPDLILLNLSTTGWDYFLKLKEMFSDLPIMNYVLHDYKGITSLFQTIYQITQRIHSARKKTMDAWENWAYKSTTF